MAVSKIVYRDEDGNTYSEKEVSQMWRMEDILIEYDCPICGTKQEDITDSPLSIDAQFTCKECNNQFFLYPKNNIKKREKISEKSTKEKIEMQFESIQVVFESVEAYPQRTARATHYPDVFVVAVIALVFGISSSITFSLNSLFLKDVIFTSMIVTFIIGILIGIIAVIIGPGGQMYKVYKLYTQYDYDCGFYTYIQHLGNYYHSKPFEMFDV